MEQGWTIHRFEQIDSTSTWLKDRATLEPHKTAAVADFQSAGRGRLGRQWIAPPGTALMVSLLLHPNWQVERGPWLTMIAGVAAAETLAYASGLNIQLKWPNDVVIELGGELHKMGGILQEVETDNGRLTQAIIGIGLNINMNSADLPPATHTPACSLKSITGNLFDRDLLLDQLLSRFDTHYQRAEQNQSPQKAWQKILITLGKRVTATVMRDGNPAHKIEGIATGVDEWGRLLIETDSGKVEPVVAGDVTLRGGTSIQNTHKSSTDGTDFTD